MLKVYTSRSYVSVDDGQWYEVRSDDAVMFDDSKSKELIFDNGSFDKWCKYLQNHSFSGIYYTTTFFKKKPCIVLHGWSYDNEKRYTHFNTLSYKIVYKEFKSASLSYIMSNFPADQCIQYLKERGITTCPMNF